MKRVLLTGATGFIGSHLLEGLLLSGYKVVIVKRSVSDVWRIRHLLHKVQIYDVDSISLDEIFLRHEIDLVIHLATLYRRFDNSDDINEMVTTNISFPVELIEAGLKQGLKGFINTGTFFEYDCSSLPVGEEAKIKPFNLYARTKLAFESILSTYEDQLSICTLRIFSPYGEKDNDKLIPMVIQKALSGEKIELSDGFQKLDFIYVKDIVSAYLKVVEKMDSRNSCYMVYNIGTGTAISIREVVSIIEQKLGQEINKTWGAESKVDVPIVFADISRVVKELDWVPEYSISKGIERTIEYYRGITAQ